MGCSLSLPSRRALRSCLCSFTCSCSYWSTERNCRHTSPAPERVICKWPRRTKPSRTSTWNGRLCSPITSPASLVCPRRASVWLRSVIAHEDGWNGSVTGWRKSTATWKPPGQNTNDRGSSSRQKSSRQNWHYGWRVQSWGKIFKLFPSDNTVSRPPDRYNAAESMRVVIASPRPLIAIHSPRHSRLPLNYSPIGANTSRKPSSTCCIRPRCA